MARAVRARHLANRALAARTREHAGDANRRHLGALGEPRVRPQPRQRTSANVGHGNGPLQLAMAGKAVAALWSHERGAEQHLDAQAAPGTATGSARDVANATDGPQDSASGDDGPALNAGSPAVDGSREVVLAADATSPYGIYAFAP
jgi:hypothetical protein